AAFAVFGSGRSVITFIDDDPVSTAFAACRPSGDANRSARVTRTRGTPMAAASAMRGFQSGEPRLAPVTGATCAFEVDSWSAAFPDGDGDGSTRSRPEGRLRSL